MNQETEIRYENDFAQIVQIIEQNRSQDIQVINHASVLTAWQVGAYISDKIIVLRDEPVILDRDVTALYGVETREINQAVKNNPDKFPAGYLFMLNNQEVAEVRSKILTTPSENTKLLSKSWHARSANSTEQPTKRSKRVC